ncbi:MAG TPA: DJ-1 family glyoxalase III [bacterium]
MTKRVLVPIANGSEEIEAVCLIDILRRAGAEVTVASVEPELEVTAARGVKLTADCLIGECARVPYDLVALPGGMPGAERLAASAPLIELLTRQRDGGRLYGAICASPAVVLEPHGLLEGRRATAHPAFADRLKDQTAVQERVVADGPCLSSRGPGTAIEFALALVEALYGQAKARDIKAAMLA